MGRARSSGMLRTALLCVVASPLLGCTTTDGVIDELAGESDADGEIGKGDGEDAFTYFQLSPDPRSANGFLASRPNRATTPCGDDGQALQSCYASSIDWSSSRLAEDMTRSFETRLRQGEPILVRGRLVGGSPAAAAKSSFESEVTAAIQPAQPMIDVGAPSGPDCLYAQLAVSSVKATTATITVTPAAPGQFAFEGRLDGVSIASSASYAVACVGGTNAIAARMASIDITGTLAVEAGVAHLVGEPVVTVTGLEVDDAGVPDTVVQMLDLRGGGAANIVVKTSELVLGQVVSQPVVSLAATEVWVPGHVTGSDDDVENVFVLAKNRGDGIREQRLNSNRSASIDTIDFTVSNATEASITLAREALAGDGVIFAGSRFLDGDGNLGRTAERFWTRVE
jgi:hypothetical protein